MQSKIHFILTGGTIDKIYDPVGQVTKLSPESTLPSYLRDFIRPDLDMRFETVCMEDSLNITPPQREEIAAAAVNSPDRYIVITHGTDTMAATAELIVRKLPAEHDKTIVLTGSLIPIKEFAMSDGGFNLGFALSSVLTAKPGVYICMHARIFEAGKVTKNTETARFQARKP